MVLFIFLGHYLYGSLGGSDNKESACNPGDPGSIPGLGRSPGEGNGNPPAWRIPRTEEPGGIAKSQRRLSDSHTYTPHMALFVRLVSFRRVSNKCLSCLPKSILAGSQLKSLSRIVIYMISNFHFSAAIQYQGSRILPLGLCSMGVQLRNSGICTGTCGVFSLWPSLCQLTSLAPSSYLCSSKLELSVCCLVKPPALSQPPSTSAGEKKKKWPQGKLCIWAPPLPSLTQTL